MHNEHNAYKKSSLRIELLIRTLLLILKNQTVYENLFFLLQWFSNQTSIQNT